jgi:hypothetical protein
MAALDSVPGRDLVPRRKNIFDGQPFVWKAGDGGTDPLFVPLRTDLDLGMDSVLDKVIGVEHIYSVQVTLVPDLLKRPLGDPSIPF